jgi:hypothetical protein
MLTLSHDDDGKNLFDHMFGTWIGPRQRPWHTGKDKATSKDMPWWEKLLMTDD